LPSSRSTPLNREVAILDCFTPDQPELGVSEVARRTGLSVSTAGRLLQTLREAGMLSQNHATRAYALGSKVLEWAGVYSASLDVRNVSLAALQKLHQITRESVSLYVQEGEERVCVERYDSPLTVRVTILAGERMPLYTGATGRVLLAYQGTETRRKILARLREVYPVFAQTDLSVYEARLDQVLIDGFAAAIGERSPEASVIAAPLLNARKEIRGAMAVSGPTQRFNHAKLQGLINALQQCAAEASARLGFSSPKL
jgi:IclR family transcriptional regulator, KDG regulon repressor